ncbi:hypothetical protein EDB89DRAFT_1907680 [Lactarius sanguifluus]|nr:hypothetical protein EDB89DRAFT_1907680 [Lactarius sanguifluus]
MCVESVCGAWQRDSGKGGLGSRRASGITRCRPAVATTATVWGTAVWVGNAPMLLGGHKGVEMMDSPPNHSPIPFRVARFQAAAMWRLVLHAMHARQTGKKKKGGRCDKWQQWQVRLARGPCPVTVPRRSGATQPQLHLYIEANKTRQNASAGDPERDHGAWCARYAGLQCPKLLREGLV